MPDLLDLLKQLAPEAAAVIMAGSSLLVWLVGWCFGRKKERAQIREAETNTELARAELVATLWTQVQEATEEIKELRNAAAAYAAHADQESRQLHDRLSTMQQQLNDRDDVIVTLKRDMATLKEQLQDTQIRLDECERFRKMVQEGVAD